MQNMIQRHWVRCVLILNVAYFSILRFKEYLVLCIVLLIYRADTD